MINFSNLIPRGLFRQPPVALSCKRNAPALKRQGFEITLKHTFMYISIHKILSKRDSQYKSALIFRETDASKSCTSIANNLQVIHRNGR